MRHEIIRLDTRVIYLEDTVQQMNLIMMEQDRTIGKLSRMVSELEEKLRELDERKANREGGDHNSRPPHY